MSAADDATTDDAATGNIPIPPRIARMWGRSAAPRKGPRPGLSREEITAAAITIADADGLAAVSMSRVAKELG